MTGENERDQTVREDGRPGRKVNQPSDADANNSIDSTCLLAPGSHFGRYEIIECIDNGGMGVVYRARHRALDKHVALKVISATLRFEPRAMERFLREMQAIGRLDPHPHVLNAYDAGDEHGVQYLVTEFIEGVQLGTLVDRIGPLSVSEACKIISQASLALEHLRGHELVHRDIKPSNLMLTRDGTVKVVDMGLALLRDEQIQKITSFGETMGSVDYMAPEQWEDSHNVDWRSDVYSLGCTFYCLLAGHAPYSRNRRGSIAKLRAHLEADFPDIRAKRSDVPEEAAALLAKMVAKDPARRLTDLVQLSQKLEIIASGDLKGLVERGFADRPTRNVLQTEEQAATIESASEDELVGADANAVTQTIHSGPTAADSTESHKVSAGWLVGAGVAVLAGVLFLVYGLFLSDHQPAAQPLLNIPPDAAASNVGPTQAASSDVISLSGQQGNILSIEFLHPSGHIATVAQQGLLCIFDLAHPEKPLHSILVSDSSADCIAYDSSEERLAIASADGWLRIHSAADGRPLQDAVQQSAGLTSVVQVPGQNQYITTAWTGDVRQLDLSTDPITNTLVAHRPDVVYDAAISANGTWLAWSGRDPAVTVLNRETQQRQELLGHDEWVVDVAISPAGDQLATAGYEGVVRTWQLPSGKPMLSIPCIVPQAIGYFPDGRHLAIGGRGSTVLIWDLRSNRSILELPVNNHIDSLAISPDGTRLAAGANDGTLTVFQISITPLPSRSD